VVARRGQPSQSLGPRQAGASHVLIEVVVTKRQGQRDPLRRAHPKHNGLRVHSEGVGD
jgi:hypothetical protein